MTLPVYKIQIYDTTPSLKHTITNEAINIQVKEVVTENIGIFSFILPTKKNGDTYYYDDVAVGWTAYIWMGYDSISGNPLTKGRIYNISAPLSTQEGYIRVFVGVNQGDVLKRRQKTKYWHNIDASAIVMELANDLGLVTKIGTADSGTTTTTVDAERTEGDDYWNGQYIQYITGPNIGLNRLITDFVAATDTITHVAFPTAVAAGHEYLILPTVNIEEDTTDAILEVCNEAYYTVLRKVSDYYDAGGSVKKDFYVTWENNLVWKARPIRTVGVETLTVGDNIISYNVNRDLRSVHNKMKIYGARGLHNPSDKDGWTQADTTGWSIDCDQGAHPGTIASDNAVFKVNTRSIRATTAADFAHTYMLLKKTLPSAVTIYDVDYTHLKFWINTSTPIPEGAFWVMLYANDSSNYFKITPNRRLWNEWKEFSLSLREFTSITGNPDKANVTDIVWYLGVVGGAYNIWVDGLHFADKRFNSVEQDAASQASYSIREYTQIDENLLSNSECGRFGQTLLYQMKDPPIRLDVTTPLNTNILVGDRLSMTIPAEGITAQNYDVISVEHNFSIAGAVTHAIMVNSTERRTIPPITTNEIMKQQIAMAKEVARGQRLSVGFPFY